MALGADIAGIIFMRIGNKKGSVIISGVALILAAVAFILNRKKQIENTDEKWSKWNNALDAVCKERPEGRIEIIKYVLKIYKEGTYLSKFMAALVDAFACGYMIVYSLPYYQDVSSVFSIPVYVSIIALLILSYAVQVIVGWVKSAITKNIEADNFIRNYVVVEFDKVGAVKKSTKEMDE
ncbi:MAG: hypothetical protein E7296_07735 [Lachnospiraceae bacterium]|nr:hypothetical protein [Lachnospiraceae bacterium]